VAICRTEARRFRKEDDPKALALRRQSWTAVDAFIKANADTPAAGRAEEMKKELCGPARQLKPIP
jgi:hypothetical protein